MNSLPAGWRWSSVAEVGSSDLGRQRHPDWHTGPEMRPYLRVANVFEDRIDTSDVKEMDFTGCFDRYRLAPGDVLLNEGQSPEFLGRPAIYRGVPEDVAFTNTLIRFRPGPDITSEWALLVFRHYMHSGRFARESRITTNIAHLSMRRFKTVEFPVPCLQEQRRIVDLLEEHLSNLDAAGDYLTAATLRLRGLRDVTVRRALTGGEDPSPRWQPDLPAVGTHDGDLVPLPLGWRWARLGDVADIAGGVTKDTQKQSDPTLPEVPYLRVANVQRGRLDLTSVAMIRVPPAKAMALTLRPGDVLLNEGGDRDKLARGWVWEGQIEGCIHQNHVFRARLKDDRLDPYFLAWTTNSFGGRWAERNGKQSVNLASISLSKIRQMPVIVPPSGVAARVAARLADDVAALDRIERSLRTAQTRQSVLAKSLLAAAFSGRLTGRSSDTELIEELADQEAS